MGVKGVGLKIVRGLLRVLKLLKIVKNIIFSVVAAKIKAGIVLTNMTLSMSQMIPNSNHPQSHL